MTDASPFTLFGAPEVPVTVKDVPADVIIEGDPVQTVQLYVDNAETGAKFGTWDCQAGTFRATMESIIEFCTIIEGKAVITDLDDGSKRTVRTGDTFVMNPGMRTEWYVETYIKKHFAITAVKV
jgi:uncharacterized cupin superfamily protein